MKLLIVRLKKLNQDKMEIKKYFNIFLLVTLIIFLVLFAGCKNYYYSNEGVKEGIEMAKAIESCISLCNKVRENVSLSQNINLSQGPCLSDIYAEEWQVNDWVCDIAHWPRQEIDNKPENQCQEYRQGKANHFVEIYEDCRFIRAL